MTLHLKTIFVSVNKALNIANAFMWGLFTLRFLNLKKVKETKRPFYINLFLFFTLLFVLVVMTYGAYRRETDC